jgi:hypothetical protein
MLFAYVAPRGPLAICIGDPTSSARDTDPEHTAKLARVGAIVFSEVDAFVATVVSFVFTGVAVSVATKPVLTTILSVVNEIRMDSNKVTSAGTRLLVVVKRGLPVRIGVLVGKRVGLSVGERWVGSSVGDNEVGSSVSRISKEVGSRVGERVTSAVGLSEGSAVDG